MHPFAGIQLNGTTAAGKQWKEAYRSGWCDGCVNADCRCIL